MFLKSGETELSKTRYQQGSVRRVARRKGPDVWVFRYLNTLADGSRKENNRVIGTVLEYRTKAAAERAAEAFRINSTTPRASPASLPPTTSQGNWMWIRSKLEPRKLIQRSRGIAAISSGGFFPVGERLPSVRWSRSSSKVGSRN